MPRIDGHLPTADEAAIYLTEEHGYTLRRPRGDFDTDLGNHIAFGMQNEFRAAQYEDGRRQNDAEHSYALAINCLWIVKSERPDLDLGKVLALALTHDNLEHYSKDTPVFDEEALRTKKARELAGYSLYREDISHIPQLRALTDNYKFGDGPEERFVDGMDAVEAGLFALNTKGALQRERNDDFETMCRKHLAKASKDETALYYMEELLIVLGRKWEEWGCKPFDEDPMLLVNRLVHELPTNQSDTDPEPDPTPPNTPQAKPADHIGELVVLSEWRAKRAA